MKENMSLEKIETTVELAGCAGERLRIVNNNVVKNTGDREVNNWGFCCSCGEPLTNRATVVGGTLARMVRGTDGKQLFRHENCPNPFEVTPLTKRQKRNVAK